MNRKLLTLFFAGIIALAGCSGVPSQTKSSATTTPASSEQQQNDWSQVRVSYLGPQGTYTQEACGAFFNGQGTYEPQEDVAASVQALIDGKVNYAVIPQENTIGGPIVEYLDELVSHENVCVAGEVELPISQNLLVKPGASLQDIQIVYSHKQGISQGSEWLKKNLSNVEVSEVSSTAEGARMVAEAEGNDCAAIGSTAAADVYGLEVLADNIQINDANKTRFYVLAISEASKDPSERMAFLASGSAGDLAELLASIEAQGMTVVAVHDRPQKTELGKYTYLIECADGTYEGYEAVTKDNTAFAFRYLGSFSLV